MEFKEQEYKAVLQKAANKIKELNSQIETMKNDRKIAVIGYDCCFPGGAENPELFWDLLLHSYDAIRRIPTDRFNVSEYYSEDKNEVGKMSTKYAGFLNRDIREFDNTHFEITANEATSMDPQHRLLLEISWRAMENAGLDICSLRGSNTGVFIGLSSNEYEKNEIASHDEKKINSYSLFGTAYSAAAGRLAYFYDFKGPAIVLDTACSSSLVALNSAIASLHAGDCDLAIVGAANLILSPAVFVGLSRVQALAPDGRCKTFDDKADGFGRGEGCGIIILKRLNDAIKDSNKIEGLITGIAVGQDGRTNGFFAPNGLAEENVMKRALRLSGNNNEEIDYIEAHGTGTVLGDYIETQAISNVYKREQRPILIGSVKSNIGHLEAAAGMASLIKILLSLKHSKIPPSINCEKPNQYIDLKKIQIVTGITDWTKDDGKRSAAINCFGITGTLAHIIIEEFQTPTKIEKQIMNGSLLTISAQSKNALKSAMEDIKQFIEKKPYKLSDICYATNIKRSNLKYRFATIGMNKEKLLRSIEQALTKDDIFAYECKKVERKLQSIGFIFTGQGSIYRNIARQVYDYSEQFRSIFTICEDAFYRELDISIFQTIYGDDEKLLEEPLYAQPIIFTIEYALAKTWASLGIKPDFVIGHSIGEIVATCYAGVISFEDAVKMIVSRAKSMQSMNMNGKMIGIMENVETVKQAILESGCKEVSIAAINAPKNVTISGSAVEIDKVVELLQKKERVFINDLCITRPYHSVLMEPYKKDFVKQFDEIEAIDTDIKVISGLTGTLVDAEVIRNKKYWSGLLSECVNFNQGIIQAYKEGVRVFIEIGGTATLTALTKQCLSNEDVVCIPTLRKNNGDSFIQILDAVKALYLHGIQIDWEKLYQQTNRQDVRIPDYPFKKKLLWNDKD